jgi:hypothetical protein
MQLFLDGDQVLADFDKRAEEIFGMSGREFEDTYGSKLFWKTLKEADGFFQNLDPMPDAMELYNAVKHLRPIILTGAPMGNWAGPQKLAWRDRHFPACQMIVVCPSRDKFKYMTKPGDILVDDLLKYKHIWVDNGGVFVHHTSAKSSIKQLKDLKVI